MSRAIPPRLQPWAPLCLALVLSPGAARACPEAVIGHDTSSAVLVSADVPTSRPYLLRLVLSVEDAPLWQDIVVDGEEVKASVEHGTPLTLAAWARHITLNTGGSSKFVLGAIKSNWTGGVALLPLSSIQRISISQGEDFDEEAPFRVELDLLLLHAPTAFVGQKQGFTPRSNMFELGGNWFHPIPPQGSGDPYGQAYGEWFAEPDYVASFVHGPRSGDRHRTQEDAVPWHLSPLLAAGFRREGDLYDFLAATYAQLQPTDPIEAMVGHPIELALVGDRTLDPPSSPWTDYRRECRFVEGRMSSTSAPVVLPAWAERDEDKPTLWKAPPGVSPAPPGSRPMGPGAEAAASAGSPGGSGCEVKGIVPWLVALFGTAGAFLLGRRAGSRRAGRATTGR